jgi:DNA primase
LDSALLEKAGLVLKRENETGMYDRFRGRAMFPIFSPSGKVVGFGARKLRDDDPMAKYINSPETPVYNKSKTLYGLSHAKDAIREKDYVLLVEGYADLISVAQAGMRNIVASSGTALTDQQIKLIDRYTKSIVLVYDGDSAGSKAMLRGVDLILEQGLDVRVIELPDGHDPDSFVRKHGGDAFQERINGAVSFLEFKADYFRRLGMLSNAEGKTRAIRSIVNTIARMKDELRRMVYIKDLAEKYGLQESLILREVDVVLGKEERVHSAPKPVSSSAQRLRPEATVLAACERDILKVILEGGKDVLGFVFDYVQPHMFRHPIARSIAESLQQLAESGGEVELSSFMDTLHDDAQRTLVSGIVMERHELGKRWEELGQQVKRGDIWEQTEGAIVAMRLRELETVLEETRQRFHAAEKAGEDTHQLQQELKSLQDERIALQKSGLRQG